MLLLVVTLWSVLLLAWLILHWGILPHIDEWRPAIERRASAAVGLPVRIGQIEVRSSGWVPALELREVVLADRDGRQVLRLPRVSAAVSPHSLLSLKLRFAQLYIEGAQLLMRRDTAGRLHVGGIDMDGSAALDGSGAADWLFQQTEFVIRGGQLRWVDEMRHAPPLELRDAELVVRNGLRRHDLRLDATPPAGWGQRFSLRGRFTQPLLAPAGDWQRWSGSAYAELPGADVASLRQHVALPFELNQGHGALRLWLELQAGQWRSGTLDAALNDVNLRLAPALQPLAFSALQGRFSAQRDAAGLQLQAERFAFSTAGGQQWPLSRVSLGWRQRQALAQGSLSAEPVTGGELQADRLDLALMAGIAERLPLPAAVRRALGELAPEGQVQGLKAHWSGPLEQPERYRVQARAQGLSITSAAPQSGHGVGRPGWRNADLVLDANETGGEAQLQVKHGTLELPGVFEQPQVALDQFSSKLVWSIRPAAAGGSAGGAAPPQIELLVQDAHFSNADAQGELQARWHTGPGRAGAPAAPAHGAGARFPGQLDLSGKISQGRALAVARYLPLGVSVEAREYVARAVLGGSVRNVLFKARGDLWEFPFAQAGSGEFRIAGQVEDATLAYVPASHVGEAPPWPPFTQLSGELSFDRESMTIRNARAQLWGIALGEVNGGIANLVHQPTLLIEGGGGGPLSDVLRFVGATPVAGWTQHALDAASGNGTAELKLALQIPFHEIAQTSVKGSVTLLGNDVRLRPDVPLLAAAKGRVDFTQHGFGVSAGSAKALGGELSFEGGSNPDGAWRFNGQGSASAEGLRRASELGDVTRLAGLMSGQAAYRLQLGIRNGHSELNLTSPLVGMALDLPAPLRKGAESTLALRLQSTLQDNAGTPLRDTLRLELGTLVQAEYQRDLSGAAPKVLRGAIGIGESLPASQPGSVVAQVKLPALDLDAWQAVGDRLLAPLTGPGAGATAAAAAAKASVAAAMDYVPNEITLRTPELLLAGGKRLSQLDASLQRRGDAEGELWRVNLQSEQAQGLIEYRPPVAGAPAGRVMARLARLAVPAAPDASGAPPAASAAKKVDASDAVPALDIVVDEFEWRGKKLGKLELEARSPGGDGRDWRLNKLNLTLPEARLSGSGLWSAGPRKRMALDFKLELADSGELVERLGMGRTVRGGKGRLQGQLGWNGAALSPDWAQVGGSLQLALDSGQFLKAEPGAARLLSVLSLQALPRRLTLDFRDVFERGFTFDNVSGDVQLAGAVARTNNLRIRGVQAVVLMEGSADLQRETQDLRVVVVPEINAGTASLAYAAINPAIGLGTFLAQVFLRKPLMQAGTREFHVTGPWAAPVVDSVERKLNEPLPDLDAPAASASMPNPP